jgi:hypothetical protein
MGREWSKGGFALSIPTEDQEQSSVIQWFDLQHNQLRGRLFAVPNGGVRHIATAARLKKTGARAGVPDLMLPVARGGFHGLFIEMKRVKNSRLSPEQDDWLTFLAKEGYMVVVCKGFEPAKQTIDAYLAY